MKCSQNSPIDCSSPSYSFLAPPRPVPDRRCCRLELYFLLELDEWPPVVLRGRRYRITMEPFLEKIRRDKEIIGVTGEIYYIPNKNNPGSIRNWQEVENKINRTLALFIYKKTIYSKLNYLIQTLEIPKNIHKRIRTQVRQFIFQDLRATTYKIQYLHDIIQNPHHNPIATYYLAMTLRRHGLTWNNNQPHYHHFQDTSTH